MVAGTAFSKRQGFITPDMFEHDKDYYEARYQLKSVEEANRVFEEG